MRDDTSGYVVVANWRDLDHPQAGGAELVCDEVAADLARRGHRVVLLTSSVAGRPREEQVHGYTVRRRGGRFTVYAWALLWLLLHRRSVRAVIDSQNGIPFFSPLAVRRSTPCLLLLHHVHQDQFALYFPRPVAAVGRFLESTVSRAVYGTRTVIAVSPSTRQGAREILQLRGEVKIVPPGWRVSLDLATSSPVKTDHPSVVSVGRLVPHKRTGMTIEAVAALRATVPDITLDVVGGGTELEGLKRLAADLGVDDIVSFRPHCSNEERDQVVAASWLCVNASEGEGWGISVIEANALGTPVVAYARPGLRDSIQHGTNGWLIDDAQPLAEAAAPLLAELAAPAHRAALAAACHGWALNFTWSAMTGRIWSAVEQETRRLSLPHPERRTGSDVSTVVRVPAELVPVDWQPRLRHGDVVSTGPGWVEVFLANADTSASAAVMRRVGIVDDGRIEYRVARRRDHLAPLAG